MLAMSVRIDFDTNGNHSVVPDGLRFGLYQPAASGSQVQFRQMEFRPNANHIMRAYLTTDASGDVIVSLAMTMRSRIYRFLTERYSISECNFGPNTILASNATNLP